LQANVIVDGLQELKVFIAHGNLDTFSWEEQKIFRKKGPRGFLLFLFLSLFFFLFSLPSFTFFHLNTMLVLFETPAGYALFKVKKDDKVADVDNLYKEFETADKANKM